ncbi:hypothetical protein FOA43_002522 [Brettanomyces nanus]|uniref:N2227-like protein n=1 Tax=Eeniella nana TaxID=13502 RepID=A0A875S2M6_EENNA|nr:uncharacterized protein FOA43_002522 [Brettanomyces nanus]QPG75173.1 hypothetical protein FOA43_002522 [Brettanomyces nanus]
MGPFFFIIKICLVLIFDYFAKSLFPEATTLWLILTSFLVCIVIRNTAMFRNLVSSFTNKVSRSSDTILSSRQELLLSLYNLSQYLERSHRANDAKRARYRRMPAKHQHICNSIGYPEKLTLVDTLLARNNDTIMRVYADGIVRHHVTEEDLRQSRRLARSTNHYDYFRVVESLCHLTRDWSESGSTEIQPLIDYICDNSRNLDLKNTTVIVPGSGLGRISHELALMGFKEVHAVDFSWLMTLFNESIYGSRSQMASIYPYVHNYSNHWQTKDQMGLATYRYGIRQPENLHIHCQNFTEFTSPAETAAYNVLIVTCFFIDTAEDLLSYVDSINRICKPFKGKKRWINVGPLKYGTAPKVELSNEELGDLTSAMGWNRIHQLNSPTKLGYLTDTIGLWQGYYGVCMWTAEKKC